MKNKNSHGEMAIKSFKLKLVPAIILSVLTVCIFTLMFNQWKAGSSFEFPFFIFAVIVLIYFPGKSIIDLTAVHVSLLENVTLSLVTGMTATSMVYWLLSLLSINGAFLLWPVSAVLIYIYRHRKNWNCFLKSHFQIQTYHISLIALLFVSLIPLIILPFYYSNMIINDNGAMSLSTGPNDLFFHMSIAQELTHAIPPQLPVFAGKALNYHCWPDLLTTIFMTTFNLSIEDLSVRFIPTFFITLAVLSSFIFNRLWLKSGYAALLATLLIFFGENLSYFFGLLYKSTPFWAYDYFRAPTTFNLYLFNTMLPALIILFSGLFCCLKYHAEKSSTWMVLTAFFFAVLIEYKIFMSLHVLLSLSITGGLFYFLHKDKRLLKLATLIAIFLAIPVLQSYMANKETSILWVRFEPQLYITYVPMLFSESLTNPAVDFIKGDTFTFLGIACLLLFVLPVYLAGSFGAASLAVPAIIANLFSFKQEDGMKYFLAVFIVIGPAISLNSNLTPRDYPNIFNNMVWFLIHSKHLAWIFFVKFIWSRIKFYRSYARWLLILLVITFSIPSSIQSLYYLFNQQQKFEIGPSGISVLKHLKEYAEPGEIVATPPHSLLTAPIASMTKLRVPYLNLFLRSYGGRQKQLDKRKSDLLAFWNDWRTKKLATAFLGEYLIDYIVIDKRTQYFQPELVYSSDSTTEKTLNIFYQNDRYVVYEVNT